MLFILRELRTMYFDLILPPSFSSSSQIHFPSSSYIPNLMLSLFFKRYPLNCTYALTRAAIHRSVVDLPVASDTLKENWPSLPRGPFPPCFGVN